MGVEKLGADGEGKEGREEGERGGRTIENLQGEPASLPVSRVKTRWDPGRIIRILVCGCMTVRYSTWSMLCKSKENNRLA